MKARDNKRNGTVEFLRILFCLIVLLCHVSKDVYGKGSAGGYFRHGQISVELFFILSGYFMCNSVYSFLNKNRTENQAGGFDYIKESIRFMVKKVRPFLFYHLIFNAFKLTYYIITKEPAFEDIISNLPSFLFLPAVGFNGWLLGSEWYIGYMLFAMIVIFPILIRWFNELKYIAPVVGICLFGYLLSNYHSVVGTDRMVRAFAGILLGISAFHGAELIRKRYPERRISVISVLSFAVIAGFIYYTNSHPKSRAIEPILVLLLWPALMVTFAERGLISSTRILNNPFVYWLGRISLPIYMVQNLTRSLTREFASGLTGTGQLKLTVGVTVLCGVAFYYIQCLQKKISKSQLPKAGRITLICLITVVILGTGAGLGIYRNNMYEEADQDLLGANMFKIIYHETDGGREADQTTLVEHGTATKTLTVKELGFSEEGRTFLGWKVYRPDKRQWRVSDSDGKASWSKWRKDYETFYLYGNGYRTKSLVPAGHTVHLYAQWARE